MLERKKEGERGRLGGVYFPGTTLPNKRDIRTGREGRFIERILERVSRGVSLGRICSASDRRLGGGKTTRK